MLSKASCKCSHRRKVSGAAAQQPQKKSPVRDRSRPGALDTAAEHDPGRPCGISPNSRRSRSATRTSSHVQDREPTMQDAKAGSKLFVGIDVAKHSFEVAVWPDEQTTSLPYDEVGLRKLCEFLQPLGNCCVVLEATGGLERRIAGELIDAGHQVAIANPRQVRDFARGMGKLAK